MMEELYKNSKKQKLVIERIVDVGDKWSVAKGIANCDGWHNIAEFDKTYDLKELLDAGWEIIDIKVSISSNSSQSGYREKYDHTILMLEREYSSSKY